MKSTLLTAVAIAVGLGMANRQPPPKIRGLLFNSADLRKAIEIAKRVLTSATAGKN